MKATCLESVAAVDPLETSTEPLAVLAARAACALEHSLQRLVLASDQNPGHLEVQVAHDVQELLRQAIQRGAQAKAEATRPRLPGLRAHPHTSVLRPGAHLPVTLRPDHGPAHRRLLQTLGKWRTPADAALGLEENAGYSPVVQDLAALLASTVPVEEARAVLEHLTGVKLPRATLDREAKRQGERARRLRTAMDQQAATEKRQLELTLEPYQMILQLDAWNIRERDAWGRSAALRRQGQEPERWHWVYTGTCFRLDQRGHTASGRPVITERGFAATRQGIAGLPEQLHAEALRRGFGQAAGALVIADGAVWIWRLADDRWPQARQRLDFYHAVQHLVVVGRALFGKDKDQFKAWLKPLVRQLKNESAVKLIRNLEHALAALPKGAEAQVVAREVAYFHEHEARLDYRAAQRAGEPIGRGPVEATCRQEQCRFKRPGQFWSPAGDEALLTLEMFWRNGRWQLLFPHTSFDPARN